MGMDSPHCRRMTDSESLNVVVQPLLVCRRDKERSLQVSRVDLSRRSGTCSAFLIVMVAVLFSMVFSLVTIFPLPIG